MSTPRTRLAEAAGSGNAEVTVMAGDLADVCAECGHTGHLADVAAKAPRAGHPVTVRTSDVQALLSPTPRELVRPVKATEPPKPEPIPPEPVTPAPAAPEPAQPELPAGSAETLAAINKAQKPRELVKPPKKEPK